MLGCVPCSDIIISIQQNFRQAIPGAWIIGGLTKIVFIELFGSVNLLVFFIKISQLKQYFGIWPQTENAFIFLNGRRKIAPHLINNSQIFVSRKKLWIDLLS